MRWPAILKVDQSLLWPGLSLSSLFLLLILLGSLGVPVGSGTSLVAGGLTTVGLVLAWGYLMAGATAAGWMERLLVLALLALFLIPAKLGVVRGYSGILLLFAMLFYLGWRWWRRESEPVTDMLMTAVLMLLFYSVAAERTILVGDELYTLLVSAQALVASIPAGAVLMLAGGAPGDLAIALVGRMRPALSRLSAVRLLVALLLLTLAKAAWDGSHAPAAAWLTAALLAAATCLWVWLARLRPGDAWAHRLPVYLAGIGLVLAVVLEAGARWFPVSLTSAQSFLLSLYVAGGAALLTGCVALALGRRSEALLAGLIGIWMLLAGGDGLTQVPVAGLSWLGRLPRLDDAALYAIWNLWLAAWGGWLWVRGRRGPAPYALLLGGAVLLLLFPALDSLLSGPHRSAAVAFFVAMAAYALWILVREAARRARQRQAAFAGMALGGALLTVAAVYWIDAGALTGGSHFFRMTVVGYSVFVTPLLAYGLLRLTAAAAAERGDEA